MSVNMLDPDLRSVAAGSAGIVLIAFLALPSIFALFFQLQVPKHKENGYQDEDGVATDQSVAQYSAKVPKILLVLSTLLGFLVSLSLAILGTLDHHKTVFLENWLNVAQWGLLVIQTISISTIRNTIQSYRLGIFSALSCFLLLVVLLFQDQLLAQNPRLSTSLPAVGLRIAELFLAVFATFASVCIPRRPHVFLNGAPINGMRTTSALGRYTFSWVGSLLKLARVKGRLDQNNLPLMDHYARSRDLSDVWGRRTHTRRLWMEIYLSQRSNFLLQWLLTLVQAFSLVAPQYITFHILKILEKRVPGQAVGPDAWIWVLTLASTTIGGSWIESWLYWISWSEIAIPIRSLLSSLVFQKAMRRKDTKGASKADRKTIKTADGDEDEDEADSEPKGKQSTVNLIGVDAKRVSDFCSFNNYFMGSVFKLVISFSFLAEILGGLPLLAGVATMCAIMPLNIYVSKKYSGAQDRLMKVRDIKMGVVTEALNGMRQIKFSALEIPWYNKIGFVRNKELSEQWSVFKFDAVLVFCWITSPIALSAASLAVYSWLYGELTPSVAFTAIGVFGSLEVTLGVMPELTTDLIDAWVSLTRIEKYLNAPEISENTNDGPNIAFENVSIAWPSDEEKEDGDERYVLRSLDISFPEKELSVISGKTGTGKSLLLASILGEVDVLSGKITIPRPPPIHERHDHLATKDNWIIPSSIAFVAQIPWIENASIKDNIIFGLPCDESRYQKVVEVCALKKDLEMLGDGENTEIGANGINLSGGQRWRVTFARALYSRAGILVLDDIFSAVDAHVGRYIFEKGLTGELGIGRTRILVTHHVALVKPRTKYIVELGDGTVEHCGLVQELEVDGTLQRIISHEETAQEILEDREATAVNSEESSDGESSEPLKKIASKIPTPTKFVEDEKREKGRVKTSVYMSYFKSSGGLLFWGSALAAFAGVQAILTGRSWWLRLWTRDNQHASLTHAFTYSYQIHDLAPKPSIDISTSSKQSAHGLNYYLGIYVGLSILHAILGTFRYWFIFTGSLRASRKLFDKLSFTILRTPLRWMDTVPLGRILNRFTTDFNVVDSRLALDMSQFGNNGFLLFGIMIAGAFVSPWVILLSVCLLLMCIYVAALFMPGAREVKRLESNAKSPVFEQFNSALVGISTIRAYAKTSVYVDRMFKKIDDHSSSFWHLWAFNRWMGSRMAVIGGFFSSFVCVLILLMTGIDASLAGFAMSFALQYGQVVIWTIRHYSNLELDMNAAERIVEYNNLPTESQEGVDPPAHWPAEGVLEVNDLVVAYAPELDPVLNGISFRVEQNERIGVVGRTGAGKSSLTLAIFRFLEARRGSIHIDGLDISKVKLHALRSRLAIIPQDPVLFSGTVRSNLDAFDEHTDEELMDALARVHLISPGSASSSSLAGSGSGSGSARVATPDSAYVTASSQHRTSPSSAYITVSSRLAPSPTGAPAETSNSNPFSSLHSPITEGGLNLSQGQRQLLCLARAIVSRPKIMVLDEATSAVDMDTDTLIQRSIREEFGGCCTLLVIAHRLSTIVDFDKILVLGEGKVVEFGAPKDLMALEGGAFRSMVEESGDRGVLEGLIGVGGGGGVAVAGSE